MAQLTSTRKDRSPYSWMTEDERGLAFARLFELQEQGCVQIGAVELRDLHVCIGPSGVETAFIKGHVIRENYDFLTVAEISRMFVVYEANMSRAFMPMTKAGYAKCGCGKRFFMGGNRKELHHLINYGAGDILRDRSELRDSVRLDAVYASKPKTGTEVSVTSTYERFAQEFSKQLIGEASRNMLAKTIVSMLYYWNEFGEFLKHKPVKWNDWKERAENSDRSRNALAFAEEVWKPLVRAKKTDLTFLASYDAGGYNTLRRLLNDRKSRKSKTYNGIDTPTALFKLWLS